MNAAFRRWLAFAVVVQVALTGCDFVKIGSSSQGPVRPSGVPDEAVWAGGVDGGNFLTMSPVRNDGTYLLKVYHDYTGDLEFDGAVKFDGAGGGSIAVIDGSTFNSWDGRRLSLMDGRTLSPVKK